MTPQQARIIVLEDTLIQAIHTVEFLHGCLTQPSLEGLGRIQAAAIRHYVDCATESKRSDCGSGYDCAYPQQNKDHLERWRKLVTMPKSCHHSYHDDNCEACFESRRHRNLLLRALDVLDAAKKEQEESL